MVKSTHKIDQRSQRHSGMIWLQPNCGLTTFDNGPGPLYQIQNWFEQIEKFSSDHDLTALVGGP